MTEKELRALIRERMRTGELPPVLGGRTFAGRGSRTACHCCGQIIARHEVVYEVQLTPRCTQSTRAFIVHTQCHWIWWEESGSQSSPPEPPRSGSHSLVWSALQDGIKRPGHSIN